jgi:homoserine kinase
VRATAFAPGSVGNVGPGFDVLGLAVDGIGDRVTVELTHGPARVAVISGRDAELVPYEASRNVSVIAATTWLRWNGEPRNPMVSIDKGLPLAGGLGGSSASSVAGAYAAARACGATPEPREIIAAALEAEATITARHLDNIAASVLGGLTISRSLDPIDAISIPVAAPWFVALVTPNVRVDTKTARGILPAEWGRAAWVQQMANTSALAYAFASGDAELLRRALDDCYAEPLRKTLIPHFDGVKRAALDAGALGCSISGSGPTVFAIAPDEPAANACAAAMREAFAEVRATAHVGPIAREGVRDA